MTGIRVSVVRLHKQQANSNVSLTVSLAQTSFCKDQNHDPQNPLCAHVIICGSIQKLSGTEADIAQQALFNRHPEMPTWPKKHNWYCAKLNITNIWVLDNYGEIKTVTPEEYYKAKPE